MTLGCVGTFGSGPVGAMPFGSGYGLAVTFARESTLNSVDVTFDVPPRAGDPGDVRDALNPANWTLVPVDPPYAQVRLCQTCVRLSETVIRVYFDGFLEPGVTYRIEANPRIETTTGASITPTCDTWLFRTFGVQRPPQKGITASIVDVANPFIPSDAPGPTSPLGTFQIGADGDLVNDSDRQNLRKRVFRRLMSTRGSFFHMPDYGVGKPLKGLSKVDALRKMQNDATSQLRKEPDIRNVSVSVFTPTDAPNILRLVARVQDRYGRAEEIVADVRRTT